MVSSFTLVTRTTASVEQLFELSLSIDEHMSSMDRSRERAIAGVTGGSIGLGETVTWRARHFGIWFTMTSKITHLERPGCFVDEQVRGPFRLFRHEHRFALEDGKTVMVDTLTIASPILGRLAERAILVPYLRRLIRRRNEHLLRVLAAAPSGNA
ncbi:MAG: cyclase [Microbacterium sp.]|uniref:SRPBCC family protein n=1 Tax=Microbacterium sp. TaxID=51671 RepID=UPI000DB2C0CE|nr:SRPBCC family protein [Microbacterium sp.]PZU39344.1 MAG: cyclase [Microbacterium sp.]